MRFSIILIIGLLFGSSCTSSKKPLEDLPESIPTFDVHVNNGDVFDGYLFLRKTLSPGSQVMIDQSGSVVWYLLSDTTISRPSTPYEESFIALHSDKEAYEISYKGDTLNQWKYNSNGGFNSSLHHEIIKDTDGNMLALTFKYIPFDLSDQGGVVNDSVKIEGIVKLSPGGKELWSWSLDQHINHVEDSELIKKSLNGHSNALHIDEDGNYLISWKVFNQIWKINSTDGSVMWKYGIRDSLNKTDWITGQHTVNRNLDGEYMVLDNGETITRAFGFKRNSDGSFVNTLNIELPDSLFSSKQGSVYNFTKDRFLFCSSQSKTLIITDEYGEILWLATSNHLYYRAHYLSKEILNF